MIPYHVRPQATLLPAERLVELRDRHEAFTASQWWDGALQLVVVTLHPFHAFEKIPGVMQDPEFTCRICGVGQDTHHHREATWRTRYTQGQKP